MIIGFDILDTCKECGSYVWYNGESLPKDYYAFRSMVRDDGTGWGLCNNCFDPQRPFSD